MSHAQRRLRSTGGRWLAVLLATLLTSSSAIALANGVAEGDRAWAGRAEGQSEGLAQPEPIGQAIGFYEQALAEDPDDLEARWKLLRALHFAGDFAEADPNAAQPFFERATEVADTGLARLKERTGADDPLDELDADELAPLVAAQNIAPADVARLYFWSAINLGAWSRGVGLLTAVRKGVANRIHRYIEVTIALEPGYDEGGAYRLLGRLHAELPKVPFVSGWVDRDQALPLIERAYALAPENPGNRLLLALTLLDLAPDRDSEALGLLDQVQRLTPRETMQVEDIAMQREARDRLAAR